jgi:ankyrin repeat protein
VNAVDIIRNTPLHVFVSNNEYICDESLMKLLCDAGAHLDYINSLGETPFDLAINPIIKQLLTRQMHLSLKCLCARLIQKKNVPFRGKCSTSLVNFVKKH